MEVEYKETVDFPILHNECPLWTPPEERKQPCYGGSSIDHLYLYRLVSPTPKLIVGTLGEQQYQLDTFQLVTLCFSFGELFVYFRAHRMKKPVVRHSGAL
jgi:hypothetical protein